MSEIEDRRQRAFEAGLDAATGMWDGDDFRNGTEEAVKVATQVRITDELIEQIMCNTGAEWGGEVRDIIEEFCSALGFEVVE